jgi:hypothetical protein
MNRTPSPIDVTPRQLSALLAYHHTLATQAAAVGRRATPLMVWGDGGIGKSRITEQAAKAAGRHYVDFRALIKDLPDLQGYPIVHAMAEDQPCPMTAPADLPPSNSTEPYLLVLEELPGAARMMQSALYGLVLEGRLNGYVLPANTLIVGTGNLATSGGVTNAMPWPLRSRFRHVELILDHEEMLAHAAAAGWSPLVLAYHTMTTGKEWMSFDVRSTEPTYACPRSWEAVSDTLKAGSLPSDLLTPVLAGSLGYGVGSKFAAFVRLAADLGPTINGMRTDPWHCPIPEDSAARWFLAATTAAQMGVADAAWAFPFLTRLQDELCAFAVHAAYHRLPALARTPEFRDCIAKNPRLNALCSVLN